MNTILTKKSYLLAAMHLANVLNYSDMASPLDNEESSPATPEWAVLTTDMISRSQLLSQVGSDTLVRYGTTYSDSLDAELFVLNKASSIARSSDKLGSLIEMATEGIPVIPFATREAYRIQETRELLGFPSVARTAKHFGGRGLRLIRSPQLLTSPIIEHYDYFMKYMPDTTEYRVWTFDTRKIYPGKGRIVVIRTAEKMLKQEVDQTNLSISQRIVKNWKNGYSFEWNDNIPDVVRDLGKRATLLFGLDFAAVDIIKDNTNGDFYVLEVNTAPGTHSDTTTRLLSQRLRQAAMVHKKEIS